MTIPLVYGFVGREDGVRPLALALGVTAACGAALAWSLERPCREMTRREGLLLVVAAWITVCLFGSLPFYLSPYFPNFTDAMFEATSGFSTTGASILTDVEVLPRSLQFWRHFTHWLGGMGIVLLGVAVLPLVGHGGLQLYRAEFSGARSERLKPRIAQTALALWRIYVLLSIAEYLALRWAGMDRFEAICHTFSTVSTGGFSTRNLSVGGFNSPAIEIIVVVFMILGGASFIQHHRFWVERQPRRVLGDVEIRFYLLLIGAATAVVTVALLARSTYPAHEALRRALFQVVTINTCTGFVTADYELWPPLTHLLLLALMYAGGCTGSTAGGLKSARIVLLGKVVGREFRRMVEPRGVFAVRLGGQVVPEPVIQSLLNLVYLALAVNFASCLLLAATGVDVLTSISAVASAMFNVGPGLGTVGPAENYAHLPGLAKWVLCGDMIAGRLEFYTVLVLLTPAFWRR